MQTADAGLLFQSASAQDRVAARQRKAARAPFPGLPEPIQLNKPLALQVQGAHAWVTEANASARKIDIASGKTRKVFKGHTGPVTCLALHTVERSLGEPKRQELLITGSWDKSIRFYDAESKEELYCIANAHTDFVKALLVVPELGLLVSGGSDKDVRMWDLNKLSQSQPPTFLASLRSHTRPVDCIAAAVLDRAQGTWSLWTADSMGKLCIWEISRPGGSDVQHSLLLEWRPHETAITSLNLFIFDEEPDRQAELWTSSADQSVQLHYFDPTFASRAEPSLRLRIPHDDVVRCAWPDFEEQLLFTGAADEVIRVWDLEVLLKSPAPKKKGWTEDKDTSLLNQALVSEVDEHFHDVHLLQPYLRPKASTGELEPGLISGSLDGTLRLWTVTQLQEWKSKGRPAHAEEEEVPKTTDTLISADEEAELEALMDE